MLMFRAATGGDLEPRSYDGGIGGMNNALGCGRPIDYTNDRCGRNGVVCEWCKNRDSRWGQALTGLRCLAFIARDDERQRRSRIGIDWLDGTRRQNRVALPYVAEITGLEGDYLFVVLADEEEPRRVHWRDVRPLPSAYARPGGED